MLTYDETLAATDPGKDAYTVEERTGNTGSWDAITVSSTTVNTTAKTVTLTLDVGGDPGRQRPSQSYVKPGSNKNLTDAIGNEAAVTRQPDGHQQLAPDRR